MWIRVELQLCADAGMRARKLVPVFIGFWVRMNTEPIIMKRKIHPSCNMGIWESGTHVWAFPLLFL
jgi:hypothetical protein